MEAGGFHTPREECAIDKTYDLDWMEKLPERGLEFAAVTPSLLAKVFSIAFFKSTVLSRDQMNNIQREFYRALSIVFDEEIPGDVATCMFSSVFFAATPVVRDRKFMLKAAAKLVNIRVDPRYYNLYPFAVLCIGVQRCGVGAKDVARAYKGLTAKDVVEMVECIPETLYFKDFIGERYAWDFFSHVGMARSHSIPDYPSY